MKIRKRYSAVLILCLALVCGRAAGQGIFHYRANLDTVPGNGFYQVLLTPELIARCKADLGDLRILGPDQRFVSYVLKEPVTASEQEWRAIPGGVIAEKDSVNKHSYITVTYPEAYEIDFLTFAIRDPKYFRRVADIRADGENAGDRTFVSTVTLDPEHRMIKIPRVRTRRLQIDIANADNAPLVVDEVAGLQAARFLLVYLRTGFTYRVYMGNAQASVPDYDLKYFTDSLRGTPRTLLIDSLQRIDSLDQPKVVAVSGGEGSPLFLWSTISLVLLLLIYFSVRMVRAIAQKDKHDRL